MNITPQHYVCGVQRYLLMEFRAVQSALRIQEYCYVLVAWMDIGWL